MNGSSPALYRLLRDIFLTAVGTFMLLHETLARSPRVAVLMVGLVVLAGPAAIRTVITAYFGRGKEGSAEA